jgi:hypothetical protein
MTIEKRPILRLKSTMAMKNINNNLKILANFERKNGNIEKKLSIND